MTIQYPPCKCGRSVDEYGYYHHEGLCSLCWIAKMRHDRQIPYELDED